LHLYQIEREKEKIAAQRGVTKEGEQIRSAEIERAEQIQRNHRRRGARFPIQQHNEGDGSDGARSQPLFD
jgi:hypothetical protein